MFKVMLQQYVDQRTTPLRYNQEGMEFLQNASINAIDQVEACYQPYLLVKMLAKS